MDQPGDTDHHEHSVLDNSLSGQIAGGLVQAGTVGSVHYHSAQHTVTIPGQLPARPRLFTNREHELNRLSAWLTATGDALHAVISGAAGTGKTSLALRWLHEIRPQFPDGQLYVDLGGSAYSGPVSTGNALELFLIALGFPPERVPESLAAREALYRSLTADQAVAVLLDNAASAAQVRPLLSASRRGVTVVTSRVRLTGLAMDGARFITLDPLDTDGSLDMLRQYLDESRWGDERSDLVELAELCGGLPLALAVVGARLATRPGRRIAREVRELRTETHRLAALALGEDISVQAVFDTSYRALPPPLARLYRLCAVHPGVQFGIDVITAAVEQPADQVAHGLEELLDRHLLNEIGDRRYQFHELVRLHARDKAEQEDSGERKAAHRRMIEWYFAATVDADMLVHPMRERLGQRYQNHEQSIMLFRTEQQALAWLDKERPNLFTALSQADQLGLAELAWQFCEALRGWFVHYRRYDEWINVHRLGIAAAERCGNQLARAWLHSQLGYAYVKLGRYQDAAEHNQLALAIGEAERHGPTQASALSQLGRSAQSLGDLDAALGFYKRSRDLRAKLGILRGMAMCQRRIGDVLTLQGQYPEAVAALTEALTTMGELGDRTQYARTLRFLGSLHIATRNQPAAIKVLTEALQLMRQLGSRYYEADILATLGEALLRHGDLPAARDCFATARRVLAEAGVPAADVLLARIAALDSAMDGELPGTEAT